MGTLVWGVGGGQRRAGMRQGSAPRTQRCGIPAPRDLPTVLPALPAAHFRPSWMFQTRDIHEFSRMDGRRAPRARRRPRVMKRSRTRWRHPAACERSDGKICTSREGALFFHMQSHPHTAPSTAPGAPTSNEDNEEAMAASSGGQPPRQRLEKCQGGKGGHGWGEAPCPPDRPMLAVRRIPATTNLVGDGISAEKRLARIRGAVPHPPAQVCRQRIRGLPRWPGPPPLRTVLAWPPTCTATPQAAAEPLSPPRSPDLLVSA